MIVGLFLLSILLFIIAYHTYGTYLTRLFGINPHGVTPAHHKRDNMDYMPSSSFVLLGHHFSSIAGAGPIVGPIIASLYFGWLPALLWVVLGSIFIGGLHDFSTLVASLRHDGKSLAQIAKYAMGKQVYIALLFFIWIALEYVIIVFADLSATTFASNGSVATASSSYIILALLFGGLVYRFRCSFFKTSLPFVALLFVFILVSQSFPMGTPQIGALSGQQTWQLILLVYCFFASILPVWLLLQPRDYLSSYLLYFSVITAVIGLVIKWPGLHYPHFIPFVERTPAVGMFPVLFITIACGAVSGFHSLVSSGTTSKQLNKEGDAKIIGYGGMLIEGVVAVIALSTVMMLSRQESAAFATPLAIYANGLGRFMSVFGMSQTLGTTTAMLIVSTFLLTTLDTATRITRFIMQEMIGIRSRAIATVLTLVLPISCVFIQFHDPQPGAVIPAWKFIWPLFGTTNQLLSAFGLLIILLWLLKVLQTRSMKRVIVILLPAMFMLAVTIYSLCNLLVSSSFLPIKIVSVILLTLTAYLCLMGGRNIIKK